LICEPINDHSCLLPTSHYAVAQLSRADLRELAKRFPTTHALAAWIRSLPQLDDTGPKPGESAPRIACDVPQRARVPTSTPNCYERALLFIVVAELLDPLPSRQLATLNTPAGRHTVAVENGRIVNLDASRRVGEGEAERLRNANAASPTEDLGERRQHDEEPRPPAAHSDEESAAPGRPGAQAPDEETHVLAWCLRIADCHADAIDPEHGHERMARVLQFFARHQLAPVLTPDPGSVQPGDFDFSRTAARLGAAHYGADGQWAVSFYERTLLHLGAIAEDSPHPHPWDRTAPPDDESGAQAPRRPAGMTLLEHFHQVDEWDHARNMPELAHLVDDWRNCPCGGPRNAVELDELRNFDLGSLGHDVLSVAHTVGSGALRIYGLGGVADSLDDLYKQTQPKPPRPPAPVPIRAPRERVPREGDIAEVPQPGSLALLR
jgi:hypothetical protein